MSPGVRLAKVPDCKSGNAGSNPVRGPALKVLAIDPGPKRSALIGYHVAGHRILLRAILRNEEALELLAHVQVGYRHLAIEQVIPYRRQEAVGFSVLDTVRWSGRFEQQWRCGEGVTYLSRPEIRKVITPSYPRAGDPQIRKALIRRFGGTPEKAIGTRAEPGPLYGVTTHLWAALAVAVTWAETCARWAR